MLVTQGAYFYRFGPTTFIHAGQNNTAFSGNGITLVFITNNLKSVHFTRFMVKKEVVVQAAGNFVGLSLYTYKYVCLVVEVVGG
jgi:hypothetical protein